MGTCSSAPPPSKNQNTRSLRTLLLCEAADNAIVPDTLKDNLAKVNDLAAFELKYEYVQCNKNCKNAQEGSLLGSGITGQVRLVRNRLDGQVYAMKSLNLDALDENQLHELQMEIRMLRMLDHPNIVSLVEVFQDASNIKIVLEHCAGKDLGHRKMRSEREICSIMFQLTEAVAHCHHIGVVHRDIKIENVMFSSPEGDSVRLIDFGLSKKFAAAAQNSKQQLDRVMQTACGTAFYMAPEMLDERYSEKADIWALGVICYMIVTGRPPFEGKTEKEVFAKLRRGVISYAHPAWKSLSPNALSFVQKMLSVDPSKRPSAKQALELPWLESFGQQKHDQLKLFANDVCAALMRFASYPQLKRIALIAVVQHLKEKDTRELRDFFLILDEDHSGLLSFDEVFEMFHQADEEHKAITSQEFRLVFQRMDVNQSGFVHHTEFLAAALECKVELTEELLNQAFDDFDVDKRGSIFPASLKALMGTRYSVQDAASIIIDGAEQCGLHTDAAQGLTRKDFINLMMHRPTPSATPRLVESSNSSSLGVEEDNRERTASPANDLPQDGAGLCREQGLVAQAAQPSSALPLVAS